MMHTLLIFRYVMYFFNEALWPESSHWLGDRWSARPNSCLNTRFNRLHYGKKISKNANFVCKKRFLGETYSNSD